MPESTVPLRVDAERNRQAILCAAATVFGRRGTGAPLDEVAREAGVGIATLYRRFPDRADLVEAVFEAKMTRYADACEVIAERSLAEPWSALVDYVHFILKEQTEDPGFSDVLIAPLTGTPTFAAQRRRALKATTALVERVVEAGVVREGFSHSDLFLLTLANSGLQRASRSSRAAASRRLGAYMLDAFRHPTIEPLPPEPEAWQRAARAASTA